MEEKCIDCGKPAGLWGAYRRCHLCHFKSDKTIPELIRSRIERTALEIDAHAKVGHGLKPGEQCKECLWRAWVAFCEAREIMGMGDTWTQSLSVSREVSS